MKRFSEQLNVKAKTVKLRAAEKRELKERLVSYMEYHPLPTEMKAVDSKVEANDVSAPLIAEPFKTFSIPFSSIFKYSASLAVMLLVIVPFVAEKSVPGDTLYAVKVQFNEELRSTLTFDAYQKVEWETERLNRRIAEARLLASEGRLTEEAEADVAEAVRTHSANAKRGIEELRTEDEDAATIASISLDTTLEVQSTSLKNEEEGIKEEGFDIKEKSVSLIASAIDESRAEASDVVTASSTLPASEKLMAKIEQNTTRVYELLSTLKEVVPESELVDVVRRIEDMERALQKAVELNTDGESDSRKQLVEVLQSTQRIIVYMTELKVVKTVNIETLIPVVLTEEEEQEQIVNTTNKLNEKIQQIELLVEAEEDEDVADKVVYGQEEINKYAEQMASSTDFSSFMLVAKEGVALADDLLLLLQKDQSEIPPVEVGVETATNTATDTEEVIEEEDGDGVPEGEEVIEETSSSTEETSPVEETDETEGEVEEGVTENAETEDDGSVE